jgi:hypothetical protein
VWQSWVAQVDEELGPRNRVGAVPVVGRQVEGPLAGPSMMTSPQSVGPATGTPIRRSASDDALSSGHGSGAQGPPPAASPSVGGHPTPVRGQNSAGWPAPLFVDQPRRLPRAASAAQLRSARGAGGSSTDLVLRRGSHQFASTSAMSDPSGLPGTALADVHVDRSLLEYLEVRNRVDVGESLRLFKASCAMLFPAHHRGEAFKIVRLFSRSTLPSLSTVQPLRTGVSGALTAPRGGHLSVRASLGPGVGDDLIGTS